MWQCDWCGMKHDDITSHECNHATIIRYQTRIFPSQYKAWLDTPAGQFAVHWAQRTVPGPGS